MPSMNILGIDMDCLSFDELFPIFDQWLIDKNSRSHTVASLNVNCCVSALFDKNLRQLFNSADIRAIDSMPFTYWARAFYHKKTDRLYGPDLLLEISNKSKTKNYTFFFYGGYPGTPERMEEYLKKRYEGINVVGKYSPPFRALTKEEDQAVCDMINQLQPDFVFVGLGSPKQDVWIAEHKNKIRGSIMLATGAAFDFFSGRIKQAPKWIRVMGFEWLYRLTQDFRRLWMRYTVYNVVFIVAFVLQLIHVLNFEDAGKSS